MKHTLRLGFAMGGGVSLGTFSGGALSEAIKLAILRGCTRDAAGNTVPYDNVRLDVFSGASAGAMALALMLRYAAHQTDDQRARAADRLRAQLGDEFSRLESSDSPAHRARADDLVVAQVVQDLQEEAWRHEISLEGLLGRGKGPPRDLRFAASIFDRSEVDRIASKLLDFTAESADDAGMARLDRRRLLADRVLFACSLSNITPILIDARRDLTSYEAGFIGLGDGGTSRVHRELRVFDLRFTPTPLHDLAVQERHPARWCRYHAGAKAEGRIGELRDRRAWAKIAATAVACGAFPMAFEPVVLLRARYEFGHDWPDQLAAWPHEKYPFTYVDGGVFNNEPIREAFRLAAFIDAACPPDPGEHIDRRIIFVDPFVDTEPPSMRVPVHSRYAIRRRRALGVFAGYDVLRASTLDRLAPHLGSILGAVFNEARVIEADKVFRTRDRFTLRNRFRGVLAAALSTRPLQDSLPPLPPDPDAELDAREPRSLAEFCWEILVGDAHNSMIPAGPLTLHAELERVIREERGDLDPLAGRAASFVASPRPWEEPDAHLWLRALVFIAVDLLLQLEGKNERGRLIAIGPFARPANLEDPKPIVLPGGAVQGFGGFASDVNRAFEIDAARYCAARYLEDCGLIPMPPQRPPPPEFPPQDKARFDEDLHAGMAALAARVADAVQNSTLIDIFPGITQAALAIAGHVLEAKVRRLALERPRLCRYELRLIVPDAGFELDGPGPGINDIPAHEDPDTPGRWLLNTFADFDLSRHVWCGPHVNEQRQLLTVDLGSFASIMDKRFCDAELPEPAQVADAALRPNPVFTLTLSPNDKGARVPRARWTADSPDARSLEETIFEPR